MSWNAIFFYLLAIISILAAVGMVVAKNPVHSAIFLVLTLLTQQELSLCWARTFWRRRRSLFTPARYWC